MWMILMVGGWSLAMVFWVAATAFVQSRGYRGSYMMQTGLLSRNPTLAALSGIRKEGRPADRRKAVWYLVMLVISFIAFFVCFLLFLENL